MTLYTPGISPEALKQMMDEGKATLVVDLRSAVGARERPYMIPGALRISPEELERRHDEIPRDAEIILYCGGGFRSALAADNLQKMGYRNVKSMDGGWRGWTERSFPTERG